MHKFWVFGDDPANCINVIAPDCIDKVASLNQTRPTCRTVAARQHQLRIREFDGSARRICWERGRLVRIEREVRSFRMKLLEFFNGLRVTATKCAQKILRLML